MNIEFHNVTYSAGGQIVIDGLSLQIPSGQRCVIAGPNGSGKTTVLRLLAGLALPANGCITLDDRVVAEAGKNIVSPARRRISMVFQDLGLWPHLSVKKHLQIAAHGSGLNVGSTLDHILQVFDLVHLTGRCPSALSGGEQQRLALARALIGKPGILLLDEAFAALDVLQQKSAVKLVRERLEDQPTTLLVVAHHFSEVHRLKPHRIIFLDGGRISADVMVDSLNAFSGRHPFIQAWIGREE